jgi:8-oxo-dGTP diphosphatase
LITKNVSLIVFYDEDKKILLQERKGMSKFGEEWAFFGGQAESNETPEQALKREILEELNFNLKEFDFVGKFTKQMTPEKLAHKFVFTSPVKDNFKKFTLAEGSSMKWFSIEETEKLKMMPGDIEIIQKLKQIL